MNKQKVIGLIIGVILFSIAIMGLTYALISWTSRNINLTVRSECFKIMYDKGTDISDPIIPSLDYTGGNFVSVKMDINSDCNVVANGKIYLVTNDTTSSGLYTNGLLNYQLLINGELTDINGSITESGTIEIDVGELNHNSSAKTTYTIYVWIDNNLVTNEHANLTYSGYIYSKAFQDDGSNN